MDVDFDNRQHSSDVGTILPCRVLPGPKTRVGRY